MTVVQPIPKLLLRVLSSLAKCSVLLTSLVIRRSVMSVMACNLTYANSEHRIDYVRYMAKRVISLSFSFRKLESCILNISLCD